MKEYYLFMINDYFYKNFLKNEIFIFKSLEQIYKMNKNEYKYAINIFNQICIPFNKEKLEKYIYDHHSDDIDYRIINDKHIISDKLSLEESIMKIHNIFIKISTKEHNISFLKSLKAYNKKIFICDFYNQEYSWLNEINNSVLV